MNNGSSTELPDRERQTDRQTAVETETETETDRLDYDDSCTL